MNNYLMAVTALSWCFIGVGCWLGWQLLRQNGRILLRLDEVEKQLDALEFGEAAEPQGLMNGHTPADVNARPLPQGDGEAQDRAARFSNRSLARSRIKRDGLKAGTSAPSFRLPRLDGGELSLEELRGKHVLLVFSDPHCGPCQVLAPHLEAFHRKQAGISVVMISRGEPKDNRAKVNEHGLSFPVVLQQRWEISRRYAMFATPVGYLIDEAGVIAHDVAAGSDAIIALMSLASPSLEHFSPAVR